MRDNQRSRVYGAELSAPTIGTGSVPEVQEWVDRITRSSWWQRRSTIRRIEVRDGRGRVNACASGSTIKLPRWARHEAIVLHEMAHVFVTYRYRGVASHGPEFAATYLALTKRFRGDEAYKAQRARFREKRVKVAKMPGVTREVPKTMCLMCRRTVAKQRAWRIGGGEMGHRFCTKAHALAWAKKVVRQG